MSECKKNRSLLTDALFDELEESRLKAFHGHIQKCARCSKEYSRLKDTVGVMKKRERFEPEKETWDQFWPQLQKSMGQESTPDRQLSSIKSRRSKQWFGVPRWVFQATAALLLVIGGVFIGKSLNFPNPSRPGSDPYLTQRSIDTQEVIHRAERYIDRSKLILVALVNFNPQEEDPYGLNLPLQQQVSQELVQQASVLKSDLEDIRQRQLYELISDLELILLQIANLEDEINTEAIEIVQHGLDRNGILMKINLFDMRKETQRTKENVSDPRVSRRLNI
jgi:hypothetical protein